MNPQKEDLDGLQTNLLSRLGYRDEVGCKLEESSAVAALNKLDKDVGVVPAELLNAAMWLHPPTHKSWERIRKQIKIVCQAIENAVVQRPRSYPLPDGRTK